MEEQKKTIKISLKTAILISLLFILILGIVIIYFYQNLTDKNSDKEKINNINNENYGAFNEFSKEKITINKTIKEDIDGDNKKEKINIEVKSWRDGPGSGDMIIDFDSYTIAIDNVKMIESDPIELARLEEENIYLKDYDEDGINELCISIPVRGFDQYEWVYKYQNNQLILLDINFIDRYDKKINRIKNLINNNTNFKNDVIFFNSKNIYLIGITDDGEYESTELYLYDSDKNIARIIGRTWTTDEYNPSNNPQIAFTKIENFISHNRDLMPIYFNEIVNKIDYELSFNDSYANIKTKYNEDKKFERILLHLDKNTNTCLLIMKFNNSDDYSYNYLPYFWGEKILNSLS